MCSYHFVLLVACVVASVSSDYHCDYPSLYDEDYSDSYEFASSSTRAPSTSPPKMTTGHDRHQHHQHHQHRTKAPVTSTAPPDTTSFRAPPPSIGSVTGQDVPAPVFPVTTRLGADLYDVQRTQMQELRCLDVLDRLLSTQWQEDIDKLMVNDLGKFSTVIKVPTFSNYYSNPESEWIQEDGMVLKKLDKCVRNMVGKSASRMDQDEIDCMNKLYPEYISMEYKTGKLTEKYINETSKEQLPFRSFYTYSELIEVLFRNQNFEALDEELRYLHEDLLELYIKSEEDKTKRIFIIEQECEHRNTRVLREVNSENERYKKFGRLVKNHVNTYLVAEILRKWVPGTNIEGFRYDRWTRARESMDAEILEKMEQLKREKRDAQFLCTYAAQFAEKFYNDQKTIIFEGSKSAAQSSQLKTYEKYSYVVALADLLKGKSDTRLSRVQVLVDEFKEGHYCLTNFVRMVENHQRYKIASALIDDDLPYAYTYCLIKEMSAGLINSRYCKCQGTFCEEFGMATVRAERYELVLQPDNTYAVLMNSSYHAIPMDELISTANQRVAEKKFNTWWYRHQKNPPKFAMV